VNPRTPVAALVATALLGLARSPAGAQAPADLQALVDAAPAGAVLRPPPGRYAGPLVIRRPIRLEGEGRVRIDAGGRGSVIRIETDGAEIRGLWLSGSGESHDTIDAAVHIRGARNVVEDNEIEDCLFGVDLQQSDGNAVRRNRIRSKPLEMGMRGDAIRLWYSRDNEIADNDIAGVRDLVVWYSSGNRILRNRVSDSRYALHFMYSEHNLVEDNRYVGNMVGVFLMYSDGVVLRGNHIERALGATGMGIGFKESSRIVVEGNAIIYCAVGIYLDVSPYEPDTVNRFASNRLAFNSVGVVFHSDWHSNDFRGNEFAGNFTPVAVRGGGSAARNVWEGNAWDDYLGFDRDADGVGDTPYELHAWADRFWLDTPAAEFFRGSPLFEAIDLLDRLAPFSDPTLIVRDRAPRFAAPEGS
jgi:nitrous oxidase accessory protein